jgi:hypothetical protein
VHYLNDNLLVGVGKEVYAIGIDDAVAVLLIYGGSPIDVMPTANGAGGVAMTGGGLAVPVEA